jgi:nicotinate-nucleotide adenylyltransferase
MKIGLFGGSFDPVHLGHLLVAQAACEELELSRLFFILAAQSPFKPENKPAPATLRARMLRLALVGKSNYELDEQEIYRGGISYTIDTVRDYVLRFPQVEIFYLIGADNVPTLDKWREADELARLVQFVVVSRPGEPVTSNLPSHFHLRVLKGFPLGVSSSQIRQRIKSGFSVENVVPGAVAEAIHQNGLYR